jgi:hypothetical protein
MLKKNKTASLGEMIGLTAATFFQAVLVGFSRHPFSVDKRNLDNYNPT